MKKVEVTVTIKSKPETIIAAFIDPDMLKAWWKVDRTFINTEVGGVYAITWQTTANGFKYVTLGNIRRYQPNRELVINNLTYFNPEKEIMGEMTLTIIAKQNGESAVLYLCQEGYQTGNDWDWYYNAVKEAWPLVVQDLKQYLENL
ncbi:SRPBCC family protein [Hanstruepera flava]|uniref:SRPBCC family protein n=1 Tax=Hanstruepera flava TaxID=2930218 RepID=UPI0020286728|nr:SRPBCC domain-containing protein [Hanstruepera flava]